MTPVSELLATKIELYALKIAQVEAIHGQFVEQQHAFVEEARAQTGAPSGWIYNTDTRRFHAPAPKVLSTTPARQAKRSTSR